MFASVPRKKWPIPNVIQFLLCYGMLFWMQRSFAQSSTNTLNGKTIHLYVESADFTAFYFQNADLPLSNPKPYHYSITLTGLDASLQEFYFSSNGSRPAGEHFYWNLGAAGLSQTNVTPFSLATFQGKDTLWVIIDPTGPITAPPVIMLAAPKTLHVLNPWPTTAPVLIWGDNKTRKMTTTPERCGWFTAMILEPNLTVGYFANARRNEIYGEGGLGSNAPFDFNTLFTTQGHSIWLDTKTTTWTTAWPNINGECKYTIAATVRDFSKEHPDFDFGSITGDYLMTGMVECQISSLRKPTRTTIAPKPPVTYAHFNDWWTTDTSAAIAANLRRSESCFEIPMSQNNLGQWEYSSYYDEVSRGFWPVNGALNYHRETFTSCHVKPPPDSTSWVTNGPAVNGNFCLESHATFIYEPGQTFDFRGDDDVWIFIDDKLVIDLGGVHTPKAASVNLDMLNLVPGQEYKWDFFYCDRQPCGSALNMKTSIVFKQQSALYRKSVFPPTPGAVSFEIWKRRGEHGSCASIPSMANDSARVTNLTYQLIDANDKVIETLGAGTFHGGITIGDAKITLDTAELASSTLTPGGQYSVVAFEAAQPSVKIEIPFRMTGIPTRILPRKQTALKKHAPRARNVLGRKVPAKTTPNIEIIKDRTK